MTTINTKIQTITISELFNILLTFAGTTIINIHAITPHNGFFRAGLNGSRKAIDKMINVLGIDPKGIMKEQTKRFLLTSCSWAKLNQNALFKRIFAELANWDMVSPERQNELLELLNNEPELNTVDDINEAVGVYETGERKNGTTVNSYLARSKKDDMGMITVYGIVKSKPNYRYFNSADSSDIDLKDSKIVPFINPNYGKVSQKQIDFGHTEDTAPKTNNFRLDRILDITINGIEYHIIAD